MENSEHSPSLSARERFLYLVIVPILFTAALIGTGLLIIHQGKSDSFASAISQAGKSVISQGKSLTQFVFGKTASPAVPAGAAQSSSNPNGQPTTAQPQQSTDASQQTGTGGQGPSATGQAVNAQQGSGASTSASQAAPGVDLKQQTQELASEYAKMSASKAAAIISNMSVKDIILTMVAMKTQQRSDILAKMDPKQAAVVSKTLENFPPSSLNDTAALQQQLDLLPGTQLALDEVVKTYNQMPDKNAALLLTELMKSDQKKAISIMSNLDFNKRASILTTMSSSKDPSSIQYATMISKLLLQSK
jgi:flagellar motility protein MotE (MotC chaperone)